uniref:Uncharacterized protein n=1 Tax=Anguilla anguilla TaxID=7936 RepID=A0A0E9VFJ0_ANGAN
MHMELDCNASLAYEEPTFMEIQSAFTLLTYPRFPLCANYGK